MNVFCYPGVFKDGRVRSLLSVEARIKAEFGFHARVPLANGKFDRTEVDMRLGELLLEAKLTESDFLRAPKAAVGSYRNFGEVFNHEELPQTACDCLSYQLIRNVLAAHATNRSFRSFCVIIDVRRPELIEAWYAVMKSVCPVDLRIRCKVLTWQELAKALPSRLQGFLQEKYGVE
jgi:restriction endonuclease-like protein